MKPWYGDLIESNEPEVRQAVAAAFRRKRPAEPVNRVGCIVEFVQGRECCCAVVWKQFARSNSFRIYDLDGKDRRLGPGRILDFSHQKLPIHNDTQLRMALRRIDRRRNAVQATLDLQTLWEVVAGNGREWWDLAALIDLYFAATPDDDERTALVRALAHGDYFEMQDRQFKPLDDEAVERKNAARNARQQAAEELAEQAAWLKAVLEGEQGPRPATAEQAIALLEEAALSEDGKHISAEAGRLMRQVHLHGRLAAFDLLVRLGYWHADENLDLRRFGITPDFDPVLVEQAKQVGWAKAAQKARRWWGRQVVGWSEDGEGCQRAFSLRRDLGGYRLGIHCAVPGLLIDTCEPLLAEAGSRGTALHLPDGRIGMLPLALEERALFKVGERQPALSLVVRVDKAWAVRSFKFRLSRVRLGHIVSLQESVGEQSVLLRRLALSIREQRQQQGALLLPPEKAVVLRRGGG